MNRLAKAVNELKKVPKTPVFDYRSYQIQKQSGKYSKGPTFRDALRQQQKWLSEMKADLSQPLQRVFWLLF